MAGGLLALLDDVGALIKLTAASLDDVAVGAAKASTKTLGVIVDDAAVTPQYVANLRPNRELPIIWKIARGSLRNKILIIMPVLLILSAFVPIILPILLIVGGSYLCAEGAHKVAEHFLHHQSSPEAPAVTKSATAEDDIVQQATRTDMILSAEIMVIALAEISNLPLGQRIGALFAVAIAITALVYCTVGLIVKVDDAAMVLTRRSSATAQRLGRFILRAMPWVMRALTVIGTIAMIWVGGHLVIAQTASLGWTQPYDVVHSVAHHAQEIGGGFLFWLTETAIATVVGLIIGLVLSFGWSLLNSRVKKYVVRDVSGSDS